MTEDNTDNSEVKPPPPQPAGNEAQEESTNVIRRPNLIAFVSGVYEKLHQNFSLVMANLPVPVAQAQISPEGFKFCDMPQMLSGAHAYFQHTLTTLATHPELVPNEVDKENVRYAFRTLAFIKDRLDALLMENESKSIGPGIVIKPEKHSERHRRRVVTALDFGAHQDGRKGRSRALGSTELVALRDTAAYLNTYTVTMGHLMGVDLQSRTVPEGADAPHTFRIDHDALQQVEGCEPPKAWADMMKDIVITLPNTDRVRYSSRSK